MPMGTKPVRINRINTLHLAILSCHVTNKIHYFSTYRKHMDTKLSKVLTYCEKLPSLKQHDPLPTIRSRENLKNLCLHLHKTYSH